MSARQPETTRRHILEAAFREIYERGYVAASLDAVLERAGVTKGALYHHFDGKKALCGALIDEVLGPITLGTWVEPIRTGNDPIAALQQLLARSATAPDADQLRFGCPLNNLCQEMSSQDEELRGGLDRILSRWVGAVRDALARGQGAGTVRADVEPERVARFVVAGIEGAVGLMKTTRDPEVLRAAAAELSSYLETLRPVRGRGAARSPKHR